MAEFEPAIDYVLGNEGGYVNDPDDPGGETKYGICKRDHPNVDILNLTRQQAEEIYRAQYWCYEGIESQPIATKLLDLAVNMEGSGRRGAAIRIVQQAANEQFSCEVDGVYGPNTEAVINRCDSRLLMSAMVAQAIYRYNELVAKNPKLGKFLRGWTIRAKRTPEPLVSA